MASPKTVKDALNEGLGSASTTLDDVSAMAETFIAELSEIGNALDTHNDEGDDGLSPAILKARSLYAGGIITAQELALLEAQDSHFQVEEAKTNHHLGSLCPPLSKEEAMLPESPSPSLSSSLSLSSTPKPTPSISIASPPSSPPPPPSLTSSSSYWGRGSRGRRSSIGGGGDDGGGGGSCGGSSGKPRRVRSQSVGASLVAPQRRKGSSGSGGVSSLAVAPSSLAAVSSPPGAINHHHNQSSQSHHHKRGRAWMGTRKGGWDQMSATMLQLLGGVVVVNSTQHY